MMSCADDVCVKCPMGGEGGRPPKSAASPLSPTYLSVRDNEY